MYRSNGNFGYATGENIPTSYTPYVGGSTTVNPFPSASYSSYQTGDKIAYGGQSTANYPTYGTAGQYNQSSGIPTRDVTYTTGNTTGTSPKITFGSKQYTSTFSPQPQQTAYVPPSSQFQTY